MDSDEKGKEVAGIVLRLPSIRLKCETIVTAVAICISVIAISISIAAIAIVYQNAGRDTQIEPTKFTTTETGAPFEEQLQSLREENRNASERHAAEIASVRREMEILRGSFFDEKNKIHERIDSVEKTSQEGSQSAQTFENALENLKNQHGRDIATIEQNAEDKYKTLSQSIAQLEMNLQQIETKTEDKNDNVSTALNQLKTRLTDLHEEGLENISLVQETISKLNSTMDTKVEKLEQNIQQNGVDISRFDNKFEMISSEIEVIRNVTKDIEDLQIMRVELDVLKSRVRRLENGNGHYRPSSSTKTIIVAILCFIYAIGLG